MDRQEACACTLHTSAADPALLTHPPCPQAPASRCRWTPPSSTPQTPLSSPPRPPPTRWRPSPASAASAPAAPTSRHPRSAGLSVPPAAAATWWTGAADGHLPAGPQRMTPTTHLLSLQSQLVPLYEGDSFSVQSASSNEVDASNAFIMCVVLGRVADACGLACMLRPRPGMPFTHLCCPPLSPCRRLKVRPVVQGLGGGLMRLPARCSMHALVKHCRHAGRTSHLPPPFAPAAAHRHQRGPG